MLQNGGSSGAAGELQQEMNSDIRAMDLGAPAASWEIMALRREMTHVTPMKTQLWAKSIYNAFKMAQADIQYILTAFIALILITSRFKHSRWFITKSVYLAQTNVLLPNNSHSQGNKVKTRPTHILADCWESWSAFPSCRWTNQHHHVDSQQQRERGGGQRRRECKQ